MVNPQVSDLKSIAISGTDWLEVPIPYIRPIFQAYVRGYTPKIWPNIWYSTSILGSWNSHWKTGRAENKTPRNLDLQVFQYVFSFLVQKKSDKWQGISLNIFRNFTYISGA